MPSLAANHSQVVHFAIALLFVGVAFRLISLSGRLAFIKHSAAVLLLLGTLAAAVSVKSGADADGPVERIPGVRTGNPQDEERLVSEMAVRQARLVPLSLVAPTQREAARC